VRNLGPLLVANSLFPVHRPSRTCLCATVRVADSALLSHAETPDATTDGKPSGDGQAGQDQQTVPDPGSELDRLMVTYCSPSLARAHLHALCYKGNALGHIRGYSLQCQGKQ